MSKNKKNLLAEAVTTVTWAPDYKSARPDVIPFDPTEKVSLMFSHEWLVRRVEELEKVLHTVENRLQDSALCVHDKTKQSLYVTSDAKCACGKCVALKEIKSALTEKGYETSL